MPILCGYRLNKLVWPAISDRWLSGHPFRHVMNDSKDGIAEFEAACVALRERCVASNLTLTEELNEWDDTPLLTLEMPCGRGNRPISIWRLEEIQALLRIDFENYVLLGDYLALCSYKHNRIEAVIRTLGVPAAGDIIYRRLRGASGLEAGLDVDDIKEPIVDFRSFNEKIRISIAPTTEVCKILCLRSAHRPTRRLSLGIEGTDAISHDQALRTLERIANSLFFQIDLARGLPLSIERERRRVPASSRQRRTRDLAALEYPKADYDPAPLSLYWYARSAAGMPLLQFLAYYQAIEFYFPTYSRAEARRQITRILKDPIFRKERPTDIGRILSVLGTSGRSGFGDERAMLRATVLECVSNNELRKFLEENEERKIFLSSKTKGLTDVKLPIGNRESDLRNDVADRLYEIRCRIVHTKSGSREGEIELLLPFSKEEQMLFYDIELVRYIAQRVLIAGSTDLQV